MSITLSYLNIGCFLRLTMEVWSRSFFSSMTSTIEFASGLLNQWAVLPLNWRLEMKLGRLSTFLLCCYSITVMSSSVQAQHTTRGNPKQIWINFRFREARVFVSPISSLFVGESVKRRYLTLSHTGISIIFGTVLRIDSPRKIWDFFLFSSIPYMRRPSTA